MIVPQQRTVLVSSQLDGKIKGVRVPKEIEEWLHRESAERAIGIDLMISVALLRLRSDLRAYGEVDPMVNTPGVPSFITISGELPHID